jgi:hypothetical protein
MTPMDSLLSAIDSARPIQLPQPIKRTRQSSPMSIESMLDNNEILNQNHKRCYDDEDDDDSVDSNHTYKKRFIYDNESVVLPPLSPISAPPASPKSVSSSCPELHHQQEQQTTVTCYHASVAQKSYGSEKRFLCPPPFVEMSDQKQQHDFSVSMSVVCETMDKQQQQYEQRSQLDEQKRGYFKYLHVSGTAKAKQFCLRVNLNQGSRRTAAPTTSFYSNPITIISKPSKKTAKTRNASSCFFNNSLVSLFNRINSQTVRTKYMSSENKQLCAKHSSWSPFEIIVVRQPNQAINPENHSVSVPVTYGTEIILKDTTTGVSSPPVIIRKVEKGQVVPHAYGLMSQMQKIALQLSSSTGEQPLYLSANGAIMQYQQENNDTSNNNHSTNSWLEYVASNKQQQNSNIELIDDHLCWTMVGISKFEYTLTDNIEQQQPPTFYNTTWENLSSHQLSLQNSPPPSPPRSIVPFPVISSAHYQPSTHTLNIIGQHLMLSTPFSRLFEFYLGPYGPLPIQTESKGDCHYVTIQLPQQMNTELLLPLVLSRPDNTTLPSGKALKYNNGWTVVDV